jgi:hypothetical protein
MAAEPFDALRLTLMQDVLPVGFAVVERARRGGPRQVLAAFDGSAEDPLGTLRKEGEPAASEFRQNLDRIRPGLGNPVVKVEVRDVPAEPATAPDQADEQEATADLEATLARIAERLEQLERRLPAATGPRSEADPS